MQKTDLWTPQGTEPSGAGYFEAQVRGAVEIYYLPVFSGLGLTVVIAGGEGGYGLPGTRLLTRATHFKVRSEGEGSGC